jgi:hypothetical protein
MPGRLFTGLGRFFDRFLALLRRFPGGFNRLVDRFRGLSQRFPGGFRSFVDEPGIELGKSALGRLQVFLNADVQVGSLLAGLIGSRLQKRIGICNNLFYVGDKFVFSRGIELFKFRHGIPLFQ